MTDAINGAEYQEALESDAEELLDRARDRVAAGEYDGVMQAILEEVSDHLRHGDWFARTYYGGSLYGSIIEHVDQNPDVFNDWETACDELTPDRALKELAYYCYEADVAAHAQEMA